MSSNNGDYRSFAFRQKVIVNIEEALKKSVNMMGPQRSEKSATDIEQQIFERSATRDNYMSTVAKIILHLQSGGQNQPPPAPTVNQGPMTPMMPDPNMQQSGQMKVSDPNAHRTDNHLLPKMLVQPSPMASMSTPSPKLPLYHSQSPAPAQQVKQVKTPVSRTVQVSSNAAYPSPSPIIPSASPAGHSPAPASSPAQFSAQSPSSLLASRISGIPSVPSVESPGSFNPPSNLGSQESPSKTDLSDKEEQLYVEKLKQLSVYTEPLRKMIAKMQNEEDVANRDSKNLTRLKRLLSILGNPKERVPYQALLKVEDVLRRKLPFEGESGKKPDKTTEPAHIGHSFLEAVQNQTKTNSLQSNNRLFQMLSPTLGTLHGPPICPPPVPSPRRKSQDLESPLPHAVKTEIAQLTSKFTVDYANDGNDGCEQTALVCSINDKSLPAVPYLVVRLPEDYPKSSPHFDTRDYETSDFLQKIKDRLKSKLASLPKMYTFTSLLLNWESAVRYVDARCETTKNDVVKV